MPGLGIYILWISGPHGDASCHTSLVIALVGYENPVSVNGSPNSHCGWIDAENEKDNLNSFSREI